MPVLMQTKYTDRLSRLRTAAIVALSTALVACGGGGGGTTTPITPAPPTPQPTGDTVVSGKISFERVPHTPSGALNYGSTTAEPVRGVPVELVDAAGAVLASGTTDGNGDYSLTVPNGENVRLRARAEMVQTGTPSWEFRVLDNTSADALYVVEGPASDTNGATETRNLVAESGWGGSGYTTERSAAPFAILDSVYKAFNAVLNEQPQTQFPPLSLFWSEQNGPFPGDPARGEIFTTLYRRDDQDNSVIYVLGAADIDIDEYDEDVVISTWGYYFEDRLGRADNVGGTIPFSVFLDPRTAFSAGFFYALSSMITDDPNWLDAGGMNQQTGIGFDLENDDPLTNPRTNLNSGWYSAGSVAHILYDLYDSQSDGVDTVSLGIGPILDVMTGPQANNVAVTSIFSFAAALKAEQPASEAGIDALLAAKNIVGAGNDAYGTAETNNAGNADDVLPIYTNLPLDGTPVEVCSLGVQEFGTFNRLSNRRLLRVSVSAEGRYQFSVSSPGNPDMALFQGELLQRAEEVGNDTIERDLTPGDYVLEVYELANVRPDLASAPSMRTCLTVMAQLI